MSHKSVEWVLNNVPLWLASPFWDSSALHSWKPRQQSFGSFSRDCSQPFSHEQAAGHACRYGFSFFWWSLVRFNCALNSLEYWQPSMGLTWIPRAFEPYHESCMNCGCIISLTSPPWVPFLMCFCVLLPSGRLGPARALPSSPPSAGLGPCPSAFAFFFSLAFSGFCPFRARCVVLVFALSLFSCVPLFASWFGNFHSIFTFISFSSSHLPRCCGACVYHLNRCKTSNFAGGHRGPGGVGDQRRHLPGTRVNVPAGLWWRPWAHLSRSWWPP